VAILVVQLHKPCAQARHSQGAPASDQIVSFSGQVKSSTSPVPGEGFLQKMRIAVETILDRLKYLMPVGAQGTSRFPEMF
jgi:hypothetical protein